MSKKDNGLQRVLRHLTTYGEITSYDAIYDYGETRLAARIYELRKADYPITTHRKIVTNRFGEKRSVARYTLDNHPIHQTDGNATNV